MNLKEKLDQYYSQYPANNLSPPAKLQDVLALESELGFQIPNSLRELYLDYSNGGFGPGVFGVNGGYPDDEVEPTYFGDLYRALRDGRDDIPGFYWPDGLIPLASRGCGDYDCIDITTTDGVMIAYGPSGLEEGSDWGDVFYPLKTSFDGWMQLWLEGKLL